MKTKGFKTILKNIFHAITILFFILVALDAPQKSNVDFSAENVATLTDFFRNSNLN